MRKSLNKTEESVFTLFSLYVLINQAFESLTKSEDILHSDFAIANSTFQDLVNDTIHEALVYQILLKSCAFIDEWDKIFGVHTEEEEKLSIRKIKQIAKPAYKCISEWKNLRDFRNEAIAHNHRNKDGRNIYLNYKTYHSPNTNAEIYLLVYCIKNMIDVVYVFYKSMVDVMVLKKLKNHKVLRGKSLTSHAVKIKMKKVAEEISIGLVRNKAQ